MASVEGDLMSEVCRLCGGIEVEHFAQANGRDYLRCKDCRLVFLVHGQLPDLAVERTEYDLHCNDPDDQRYRAHLAKLAVPLVAGLATSARGLDFGCGPGPTISVMLGELGYEVVDYDPAFFADAALLERQYDFISCTEVVEHFHDPARDFALLASLLKPGGRLGIMTQMLSERIEFENWYYTREISHVAFYSVETFGWIGRRFGWKVEVLGDGVVFMENFSLKQVF